MKYTLWLDDKRSPTFYPEVPVELKAYPLVWARDTEQAQTTVQELGFPIFMFLDHDLGGDDISTTFLKWLANEYPEPPVLAYIVLSSNIPGSKNIISFMESWKKVQPV